MRNLKESSRNPSSSGCEDLHNAARTGDLNVVQKILSSNPLAINSRDKHSRTPLHLAAWSGQAEVVNYLCKNKADVGAAAVDDMGAIHFAAQKGHLEVVRTLVLSGVSVKASTRKGLTTLHYAAQGSHLELVKYLVRKGANISSKSKAGKTPLDLANSEEVRSYLKECEKSAKKGNELNDRDKAQKSDRNPPLQEEAEDSDGKAAVSMHDVEVDVQAKRKGHEDAIEESSLEPKKARIALKHLLTADDNLDDNENL